MVISRSVFGTASVGTRTANRGLQNSTSRLHRSTSKLEIDLKPNALTNSRLYQPSFNSSANRANNHDISSEFDLLELEPLYEFHQTTRELAETTNDNLGYQTTRLEQSAKQSRNSFRLPTAFDRRKQDKLLRRQNGFLRFINSRLNRTIRVTAER